MAKYRVDLNVRPEDLTEEHHAESNRLLSVSLLDKAHEKTEIAIWSRVAPLLIANEFLNDTYVDNFTEYCRVVASINRLVVYLRENEETYSTETRNGLQIKSRPQVGQLNELRRQLRGYVSDFGLSPQARKALEMVHQLDFSDLPDDANPFTADQKAAEAYSANCTHH